MTSACRAILDFLAAALAFVMGSPSSVIQKQGHASIVGGLQLEETVKGMEFIYIFIFNLFLLF